MKTVEDLRNESIQADRAYFEAQNAAKAVWSNPDVGLAKKEELWQATEKAFRVSIKAWTVFREAYDAELYPDGI